MLNPEKMALVTFAGPKAVMPGVINALYDMGILHIEEGALNAARSEGFDIGEPMDGAPDVAEVLVRARSAMSRLGIDEKNSVGAAKKPLDAPALAAKKLAAVEAKILEITGEQKKIDEDTSRLTAVASEIAPLASLGLDVSSYAGYKSLSVFVGYVGKTNGLKEKISSSSRSSETYIAQHEGRPVVAVFCDAASAEAVRKTLSDYGFSEISTKGVQALRGKPRDILARISEKLSELRAGRARLDERIAKLGRDCSDYLASHASKFEEDSAKLDAPLKFAASKNAFIASGWIPAKNYATFEARLRAASDDKIFVTKEEGKAAEDAPVELANPRAVKPYQFFLDMYSLPKYTEIDPTFFMFLTFPFFFGFMLGDIGYGLLTLLLFLILRSRMPALRGLLTVMSFSSLAAIIFGLAYGEFFGLEKLGEFELPHILHRATEANELFMAAVAVGAVHVTIGFVIGFYNVLRMHGFWHALFEKGSWLLLEAGAAVAALPSLGYTAVPAQYGYVILGIAVLMLLKGEGVRGILELPSLLANILSYARLMAVGLVSVILAVVVNENAAELFHAGPIGIIAAIVILVAGHGINIGLGLLSPFIHSMRLHYVEFFLKFYHGGGKRYMPFGLKRNQ